MSAAITSSPANQDRPLLMHPSSSQPSNQRRIRTLLDLLTIDKTDGGDQTMRGGGGGNNSNGSKWKILRERLGLKVIGCCGVATWPAANSSPPQDNDWEDAAVLEEVRRPPQQGEDNNNNNIINNDVAVVGPTTSGMNLAAALAAERQFRAAESTGSYGVDEGVNEVITMTPSRVSLMRLLEETTDGCDLERRRSSLKRDDDDDVMKGSDSVCCVCMERKKGAAFIPCGHTYCRVCSREVWVNRGTCPLCNRRILEILDIF